MYIVCYIFLYKLQINIIYSSDIVSSLIPMWSVSVMDCLRTSVNLNLLFILKLDSASCAWPGRPWFTTLGHLR